MIHARRVRQTLYSLRKRHSALITLREFVEADVDFETGEIQPGYGNSQTIRATLLRGREMYYWVTNASHEPREGLQLDENVMLAILDKRLVSFDLSKVDEVQVGSQNYEIEKMVVKHDADDVLLFLKGVTSDTN